MEKLRQWRKRQEGKMGYILLWALGVPIPVLFVIFLLRGCTCSARARGPYLFSFTLSRRCIC